MALGKAAVSDSSESIDSFAPAHFDLSACPSMSLDSRRLHSRAGRLQLYARRRETLVAFTSAKTLSPGMIFISLTERVVMIDAISPMLVSTITSLMTLSDTMLFTFPGSWFRMLSSIRGKDSAKGTRCHRPAGGSEIGNACASSLCELRLLNKTATRMNLQELASLSPRLSRR